MGIPKVLFQTSKYRPKKFPVKERLGPDWTYIHFTDEDIFEFFKRWPRPEFPNPGDFFRAIRLGEHKADFFRLYHMFVKGGVFLDSDAQLVGPIDTDCSFFTADTLSCGPVVFNGFMGSEPMHPLVYEALHYMYCKGPHDWDYFLPGRNLYTLVHSGKFKNIKVYSELPFQDSRTWVTFDGTEHIVYHYTKLGFVPPPEMYMRHWDQKYRLGGQGDGGYVIAEGLGGYDMFISAGVGWSDQFALDFTKRYGMKGYAFDGTIERYPHDSTEMTFIRKNVEPGCDDFNRLFESSQDVFLKMDIEGAEYPWFEYTPHFGRIKQMVVEFHDVWDHIDIFDKILQTHRIVHAHANNYGDTDNTKPRVIEMTFVRKEYVSDVLNTTPLPIEGLDTPNNLGAPDLYLNFEPFVSQTYSSIDPKQTFERIYAQRMWGQEGGGSGPGSSIPYTEVTRDILFNFIVENNIRSVVDAPCGSCAWQPLLLERLPEIEYYGFDVVPVLIDKNIITHQNKTNWHFGTLDLTKDELPHGKDLILSRDTLQHLSLAQIWKVLAAFKKAAPKFLLVGSYPGSLNSDITTGDYFPINLTGPPFSLQPHAVFNEQTPDGKHLLLYTREQMNQWKLV